MRLEFLLEIAHIDGGLVWPDRMVKFRRCDYGTGRSIG